MSKYSLKRLFVEMSTGVSLISFIAYILLLKFQKSVKKKRFKCCCMSKKPPVGVGHRVSSPIKKEIKPMDPFNPQASVYKTCCAHVRTATIVCGIIEIFAICFILVAVLPDMNMSVCKPLLSPSRQPLPLTQLQQQQQQPNVTAAGAAGSNATSPRPSNKDALMMSSLTWIRSVACDLNVVWLVWAIAQIFSVNLMFYGIKNVLWYLYLPHLLFRTACFLLLGVLCYVIFIRVTLNSQTTGAYILASVISIIIMGVWLYIMICELRCMHFTKRSADTGFSVSQTRQFAPPTTSLSDHAHAAGRRGKEALQQLPPLRHGFGVKRTDGPPERERRMSLKSVKGNST